MINRDQAAILNVREVYFIPLILTQWGIVEGVLILVECKTYTIIHPKK